MLVDTLATLALIVVLVLFLRLAGGLEVWPAASDSRFELGWPRGVQEEEPVRYRTELLTTPSDRRARPMLDVVTRRPHYPWEARVEPG